MSEDSQRPLVNGHAAKDSERLPALLDKLNKVLQDEKIEKSMAKFHGDELLADKQNVMTGLMPDLQGIFTLKNMPDFFKVMGKLITTKTLDMKAGAQLVASMPIYSQNRANLIESQVTAKYEKMLHPPLTYLGDAFQYRQADGKFNSVLHPHLGQAGAPYAKTVPSVTHSLGALPDPGDVFDRLMARKYTNAKQKPPEGRQSMSGLSSLLIYHATVIIHDIFRTNNNDKNISDSSSYLDLSPLYGYTEDMVNSVRDDKYRRGLLKPDTFAEDRLLRQPPGVCIYLVMYNRYHNYAANQLYRINENNRFRLPKKFDGAKLVAIAKGVADDQQQEDPSFKTTVEKYTEAWKKLADQGQPFFSKGQNIEEEALQKAGYKDLVAQMQRILDGLNTKDKRRRFAEDYDAAWKKLDDDLFQTARLITSGIYINISIHDYLRALMGFHQWNTNFTLDPRLNMTAHKNVTRGIGNQVTVEFNLLYRFHCAISMKDEEFTEDFMRGMYIDALEIGEIKAEKAKDPEYKHVPWSPNKRKEKLRKLTNKENPEAWDPREMTLKELFDLMGAAAAKPSVAPENRNFGLVDEPELYFQRNEYTNLFDDEKMVNHMLERMGDPISNFGPNNIPLCLKQVEIMGIYQARKWEIGTLNDFREFFGMKRHATFESISKNEEVQDALRDLYDHPDKVELYPGVFCESEANMNADPGPSDLDSALWAAIFSDAITLVRSDRFYTVDWNTKSLTSWGMKEVSPDNDVLKSSVYHRLLQRAFPEWFPYDSIHFFHPFYTGNTNAKFAQQQGFADSFRMTVTPSDKWFQRQQTYDYNLDASKPQKPPKPIYLYEYDQIKALLNSSPKTIINPAIIDTTKEPPKPSILLPYKVAEVLDPRKWTETKEKSSNSGAIQVSKHKTIKYFTELMHRIVKREAMTVNRKTPTYQIDVTRDLAIPVITQYVADLLGFKDKVRTVNNPKAPHSENEIYQHITNCQIFMSYNPDETKMWKRRAAFKTSMQFLFDLTEGGNIKEANRWLPSWSRHDEKNPDHYIGQLGKQIARKLLQDDHWDSGRAAAKLLLIALDSAYNSVYAFSSVLNHYINELYDEKAAKKGWIDIQKLAMGDQPEDEHDKREPDDIIRSMVLEVELASVKIPVIRRAAQDAVIRYPEGANQPLSFKVKKNDTVVCDIHAAMQAAMQAAVRDVETRNKANPKTPDQIPENLAYGSALSEAFARYNPKEIAINCITAMIKAVAQMKNLRRGHDTQGHLKKVQLPSTNEGWADFLAPGHVKAIAHAIEDAKTKDSKDVAKLNEIYNPKVLKPASETFLTPEWDEMVPFPTTWKLRFDGYGRSTYSGTLEEVQMPDNVPPFYQPQGPSTFGGSFAEVICVCNVPGRECKCKDAQPGVAASGGSEAEASKKRKAPLSVLDLNKRAAQTAFASGAEMPSDRNPSLMGGCGVPGPGTGAGD